MPGTPVGTPGGADDPGARDDRDAGGALGRYAGLGIQFAASIIVFLYLGQWLDRKLGTAPWMLLIGVFLGAGASFWNMYRKLMAAQAREDAERLARRGGQGPR